jgi:hypothetical protein
MLKDFPRKNSNLSQNPDEFRLFDGILQHWRAFEQRDKRKLVADA